MRAVNLVVNPVEGRWARQPERLAVRSVPYRPVLGRERLRWTFALLFCPPRGGWGPRQLTGKPKRTWRTIGKLLLWACLSLLLFSSTGCSRDAQHAQESGKKIDLTLPEPQVRLQPAQKPAGRIEASTEKKEVQKKNESASATAQRGVTQPATSPPKVAPVNDGRVKQHSRATAKTMAKKRESAAINARRPAAASMPREAFGNGDDPKQQDSRASEGTKRYEDSDNPLHPSYRKK